MSRFRKPHKGFRNLLKNRSMKNKSIRKNTNLNKVALLIMMVVSLQTAMAQDPGDPSADDPAAPLDGGITLLLAAGAAYGARRLKRNKEEEKK